MALFLPIFGYYISIMLCIVSLLWISFAAVFCFLGLSLYSLQDFKNALREDTIDYSTYTANIKRKRPPSRRGGKAVRMADMDDDYDNDDEDWGNSVSRLNKSSRKGSYTRTRQRQQL